MCIRDRIMKTVVWGVSATDPVIYGVIASATIVVVCGASIVPALRAARVDPVEALKAG